MSHIFLGRAWKKGLYLCRVSSTVPRTLPPYSHKQKAPELYVGDIWGWLLYSTYVAIILHFHD